MSEDFGSGVSRTLSALARQFQGVIAMAHKPPLDSDYNLVSQIHQETIRQAVQAEMPSGFLSDPIHALDDYVFDTRWANFFKLGNPDTGELEPTIFVNVNGWILPITGADVTAASDVANRVRLYPPPLTDARIDMVFLEAWQTIVRANPATENKPSADKIWAYGNVQYGGTNITDDITDPTLGIAASKRLQVQYRIRVYGHGAGFGAGVALDVYPDGLGDPNILGQGTGTTPVGGLPFTNMREILNDPSLWRAGDGDPNNAFGTVDGYVYAIPICAAFRRNAATFVAVNQAGNPNQNGSFERTPSSRGLPDPLTGANELSQMTLNGYLSPTATGVVQVNDLIGSGFDDSGITLSNVFMVINNEIVGISAIDTGVVPSTVTIPTGGRGRNGTDGAGHQANTAIHFFNNRPDDLFADEVAQQDLLDLRRAVTPGQWDYNQLLLHNLGALTRNKLRSTFKASGAGDTEGVSVTEVDYLLADGATAVPNHTEALDGPDGIRTIFSDSATPQPDVTILLDNDATLNDGFTVDQFDTNVSWDVGPDFKPTGFMNNEGASGAWRTGSLVFMHIGGTTGDEGARATFRDGSTRAVRFLSPQEWWAERDSARSFRQAPVTMRFNDQYATMPDAPGEGIYAHHPGPLYPWRDLNFESPFIALGGLLHSSLRVSGIAANADLVNAPPSYEIDVGLDFDAAGGFYSKNGTEFNNDPSQVTTPFLRGQRTLYGMLTNDGRDRSGNSSEVYIAMWGDPSAGSRNNNGIFRILGAGQTAGYTQYPASSATHIVVQPLSSDFTTFNTASAESLTAEFRSMVMNAEDGSGFTTGPAAMVIGITDLRGEQAHPWNKITLGDGSPNDDSIPASVPSKAVVNMTLQYHPSRGGTARVADHIDRVSMISASSTIYLRQPDSLLDAGFPAEAGTPTDETFYDGVGIQTWNRLSSEGLDAPYASRYGGDVVGFSEQDREHELFYDRGSKTVFFRPFQRQEMTILSKITKAVPDLLGGASYPAGSALAGVPRDGATIFTPQRTLGFPVPPEYMPRFGRHDIPYYQDKSSPLGTGNFLDGINHLLTDSTDPTKPVFYVIGGEDNTTGGNLVKPMYFQTGTAHSYAHWGTITGGPLNQPAYQARRTATIGSATTAARNITDRLKSVASSDLGRILRGIQLPPYLGIARLYGVYDRVDYIAKGGRTFQTDRITPDTDPASNLLRRDQDQQTLFLFQDGAEDQTSESGDHTYIIPEEALDISKSPNYSVGQVFDDFDYVVECEVFGFARNWINENNYILGRRHTGTGVEIDEGTIVNPPELEGIEMVIPSPASINQPMYVDMVRTVYQGDPFMTRAGNVRTTSDYEHRYGQVPVASAQQLAYTIQQYNNAGNLQVETPNPRSLEILASVDFFTTLGSGKIGGNVFGGTVTDVGNVETVNGYVGRIPRTSVPLRVLSRTFTEGQKTNSSRAEVVVEFTNMDSPLGFNHTKIKILPEDVEFEAFRYDDGGYNPADPNHYLFDEIAYFSVSNLFPAVPADGSQVFAITRDRVEVGDLVMVSSPQLEDGLVADAYVSAIDTIQLRLKNMTTAPIAPIIQSFNIQVVASFSNSSAIDKRSSRTTTARSFGARVNAHPRLQGVVTAHYEDTNVVTIRAVNPGEDGNDNSLVISSTASQWITIRTPPVQAERLDSVVNAADFTGGEDQRVTAGQGHSSIELAGMTERFPMGILLQDADFLGEQVSDPYGSSMMTSPSSSIRPVTFPITPLTDKGEEYTQFLGLPGEYLGMADGGILKYVAFHDVDRPTGTKKFRLFRGGGSMFQLSGDNPGGPVQWIAQAPFGMFAKGAVLTCRAMLVRNFPEEAFSTNTEVSDGDEIQMVLVTLGISFTRDNYEQMAKLLAGNAILLGLNSPTEWGLGLSAADRYRLNGKPMIRRFTRKVRSAAGIPLAPFNPIS